MSTGAVSADQIRQVVQQSLQVELDKIELIREEKNQLEDKQLAFDNIDNIVEELEDSLLTLTRKSTFSSRTASSSNPDLVTASASTNAAKTSFTFSSIDQLASAARVSSSGSLGLAAGTGASLISDPSDVNGGSDSDYNPNSVISSDQGLSPAITSGSMTINSVSIDIKGTDTLYTILSRINNAGADVVATFDEDADTVKISGTRAGAEQTITFNSGETNFFEALNLSEAEAYTAGTDHEKDRALDTLPGDSELSGIIDGFFNINNHTFEVDASEDSMQNLINRVNSSNAGAVMFYDEDTGKVTLSNETTGEPLLLNNDTSGFLSAIQILDRAEGDYKASDGASEYRGEKARFELNGETVEKEGNVFTIGGVTFSLVGTTTTENPSATVSVNTDPDATVKKVQSFVSQFNATMSLLNDEINKEGGPLEGDTVLRRLMTKLRTNVLRKIDNPGQYDTLIDIGLSFNRGGGLFTLELDSETLTSKLDEDETSVRQLFAYNNDSDGLLDDGGYAYTTRETLRDFTRTATGYFYKENDRILENIERLERKIYNKEDDLMDQEKRLFKRLATQIRALQELQAQGQKVSQINSIVMNAASSSASNVFSASLA